jgi:hypothetical protein
MKQRLSLLLVGAAILAAVGASRAQEKPGVGMAMKMDTVTGVLVDTKCYGMMPKENVGNDHVVMVDGKASNVPSCAQVCANMGIPVGLKTTNGKTVVLAAPASQLSRHMAQEVTLNGVYAKDRSTFIVMRVIPKNGEPYDIKTMM